MCAFHPPNDSRIAALVLGACVSRAARVRERAALRPEVALWTTLSGSRQSGLSRHSPLARSSPSRQQLRKDSECLRLLVRYHVARRAAGAVRPGWGRYARLFLGNVGSAFRGIVATTAARLARERRAAG